MTEFVFDPKKLKDGLTLVRIIKPEIGDFSFKFSDSALIISSTDKRRYIKVVIPAESSPPDFSSDEMHISMDRIALFDTELSSVSISVNDKSISIKMSNDDQVRRASITRRTVRVKMPEPSIGPQMVRSSINTKLFDHLLRCISCSALIKETKTEEEMRVNQVHFYPEKNCVVSNARYYGSMAFLEGMQLDFSIISSDIPIIRAFCAKCVDPSVDLLHDNQKLCIVDASHGTMLVLGRITTPKPTLSIFDQDKFNTVVSIDKEQFAKNLSWADLVIEGTQRLSMYGQNDQMVLRFGQDEISNFPVKFIKGTELRADFPINVLINIIGFIEKTAILKFNHDDAPTLLEVSQDGETDVRSMHYLQSMRMR